ncbi:M10 family metallopeptidase C-terminal domain-containing protein [Humitalea sp. 24SJ18S-53]|uniref:M10 family metallopeptidase C-terminal domain-containing protein n=1 Tax=Humitalea sp. 24SJ18S-53 TaxID=3422307 RepID=UPI003D66F777
MTSNSIALTCGCPCCAPGGGSPQHFLAETLATTDGFVADAGSLGTSDIAVKLRTQWSGFLEGKFVVWNKASVSYSVNDSAPGYYGEHTGLVGMTGLMQARARDAFALWDDLIPLSLVESQSPTADITFNMSSNTQNATYSASGSISALNANTFGFIRPQIWLASGWSSHNSDAAMGYGGYGFMTYLHEIGHALGLSHPGSYNAAPGVTITYGGFAEYREDTRRFTVMSYFNAAADGSGTDHYGSDGQLKYAQTPMVHDILAIQAAYGVSTTTRAGNTTYGFNANADHGVYDFASNRDPILTIFDSGGNDTIDLSGYSLPNRLDLNESAYSDVGGWMTNNLAIAIGTIIENGIGGSGADRIFGNPMANALYGGAGNDRIDAGGGDDHVDGGDGDDHLFGDGGNDMLIGGRGDDVLDGGAGFDTAYYDLAAGEITVRDIGGGVLIVQAGRFGTDRLISIESIRTREIGVFDTAYYISTNADVATAGVNAYAHYDAFGWREGRDPSALFSTSGYIASNQDIKAANINPLSHYVQFGWREGRDPNAGFDVKSYLNYNADVRAAQTDPLVHYETYGKYEGRASYKAIGDAITSSGFDIEYYLLANSDIAKAGVDAFEHYKNFGWREGRNPNAWFDTNGYLDDNIDVKLANVDPLQHYMTSGWREGRDPHALFDTSSYLSYYQDVAASGVNPLLHYLQFGYLEGRSTFGDGTWH